MKPETRNPKEQLNILQDKSFRDSAFQATLLAFVAPTTSITFSINCKKNFMEIKTFHTIKPLIGLTDGKSSLPNGRLLRLSTRGTYLVRCLLSSWTCISVLLKSFSSFLMAAYKHTHITDDIAYTLYVMRQTYKLQYWTRTNMTPNLRQSIEKQTTSIWLQSR